MKQEHLATESEKQVDNGRSLAAVWGAAWRVFTAVAFFLVFGLILAGLNTLHVVHVMQPARAEIDAAFASGRFPAITLDDGIATVHGPEPFVVVDQRDALVVFDTTGRYTGIELLEGNYDSGVILTRDAVYSLDDEGNLNSVRLPELNALLGGPIRIDAALAQAISSVVQGLVFIGLAFWHVVMRFVYVAMVALAVWGVATIVRGTAATGSVAFAPVWATGLFATVAAVYGDYLLNRLGVDLFGRFTLLLLLA